MSAGDDTARGLLGRVLRGEVNVSSLFGFLTALDPEPLQTLFALDQPVVDVKIEVQYGRGSRLDVVLYGTGGPLAVLEFKVAASEHGNQLERYDEFAQQYDATKVLVDLELPGVELRPGWSRVGLAVAFGCWANSANDTARVFGTQIAGVFQAWGEQADGPLSGIDAAMYPVVLRGVRDALDAKHIESYAAGTSAGQPSLTAFKPHPSGLERTYLCVDLRCQDKKDPTRSWILRFGIQVDPGPSLPDDRKLAHQLAMELEPALNLANLQRALKGRVLDGVVAAIHADPAPLKAPPNREPACEGWLAKVDAVGGGGVSNHPIFYHDWGRRLAAKVTLDPAVVTPQDLEDLTTALLDFLGSQEQTDASSQGHPANH